MYLFVPGACPISDSEPNPLSKSQTKAIDWQRLKLCAPKLTFVERKVKY